MLDPRIIPCLLVHNKGLVKTVKFKDSKYIGDPINAVKIFNEKEVDELIVLDIDATIENREPDYKMIENLANECRMPLCYGGGIKTASQAQRILSLGVEKIAISSAVFGNSELVAEISSQWCQYRLYFTWSEQIKAISYTITFDLKLGDLLLFDGNLIHKSNPNKTKKCRVIGIHRIAQI